MVFLRIKVSKEKNIYQTSWVLDLRLTATLKADARRNNNHVVGCAGALFLGINDNQLKVMPPLILCFEVPLQYMFTC